MTDTPGVIALRRYRAELSKQKHGRVVEAIADALHAGVQLSITEIARNAAVSREFIYSHPELLAAYRRALGSAPASAPPKYAGQSRREVALLAERKTLMARIDAQDHEIATAQQEIADFKAQRERWLGAQLDQMMHPARLTELTSENEQLTRRLVELNRLADSQERALGILREELRISRLAHAETAAELDPTGRVTPLRRAEPSSLTDSD